MQFVVKGRHMNLTNSLKAHAREKLGESLMRIFDKPAAKVEIELADLGDVQDQDSKECRVTVFIPHGPSINIRETDDDMFKAIDLARDRLINQVKRAQGKKRHTSRDRKDAERARQNTATRSLTAPREEWEREVDEFELSRSAS